MKMKDIEFTLKITLDRFISTNPCLGAVTLNCKDRKYILDVCQSYTYNDDDCENGTTIQCDLEVDKDTFKDCKFNLRVKDLSNKDLTAEFFIDGDGEEFEIESMILNFKIDGVNKSIKVEVE